MIILNEDLLDKRILEAIPHRSPFLLVDKIEELKEDIVITSLTIDPSYPVFKGHFPQFPIYPGVLSSEGLYQSSGIFYYFNKVKDNTRTGVIKNSTMNYTSAIIPNNNLDKIYYHVKLIKDNKFLCTFEGKIIYQDKVAVEGTWDIYSMPNKLLQRMAK